MSDRALVGSNPAPTTIRWAEMLALSIVATLTLIATVGPLPALVVVIGVATGVAMMWRADVATIVFAFLFYANVLVVATQFHGVPTVIASLAGLLLLLPLVRSIVIERQPVVVTPALAFMLLFLVSMLVSTLASPIPGISLPKVGAFVLEGLLLYVLVSNVANDADRIRRIVLVLVIAAVCMASLSVFQELTRSYDNNYAGFAQVSEGGFDVGEGDDAVLRQRLSGPIGEQNRYAQVLLMVVPLAYFAGTAAADRTRKLLFNLAALVITAGVFLTFSRGAAVATFVVLLMMVFHRVISIGRLAAIVIAGALLMSVVAPDYVLRIASLGTVTDATDTEADVDGAIRGRTTEALAAINVFVEHPVVGVGPDRFFQEFSQIEANKLGLRHLDSNRRSHNLYLELAADQGVLGLTAFGLIMTVTVVQLAAARRRWAERDRERAALAGGFMFALYSYLITAFFLQLSYQRYLWAMVALANGVIWCLREPPDLGRIDRRNWSLRVQTTTPSEISVEN